MPSTTDGFGNRTDDDDDLGDQCRQRPIPPMDENAHPSAFLVSLSSHKSATAGICDKGYEFQMQ
jgi:hypothetical protein